MPDLTIDRAKTALLIMDYQEGVVPIAGDDAPALVARANETLVAARAAGIPVIYIVVRFRAGHPEISDRNMIFAGIKQSGGLVEGTQPAAIHSGVAPEQGDIVVVKHRVGAFQGTDVETILRAKGIETLVLFGVATYGVVLSTVRYAADADYRLVVLRDLCADPDPEVHRVLLDKVFTRQAAVVTSEAFRAAIA